MSEQLTPLPEEKFVPDVELQASINAAMEAILNRSYSERHPELGKMFKCVTCGRRHRAVQQLFTHSGNVKRADKLVGVVTCDVQYAVDYIEEDLDTGEKETFFRFATPKYGLVGPSAFKGKRRMSHPNKKNLQLVELTQELFPNYEDKPLLFPDGDVRIPDAREAMHAARSEATTILRRGIRAARKRKNAQSSLSRRINLGLARAGSRI